MDFSINMNSYESIADEIYKIFCKSRKFKNVVQIYIKEEVMVFKLPYDNYKIDRLVEEEILFCRNIKVE